MVDTPTELWLDDGMSSTQYTEARQRIAELQEAIAAARTRKMVRELNEELDFWQGKAAALFQGAA